MDTPGLSDTDGDDNVIAPMITKSLYAVTPGPHAIILVVKCHERFTSEEVKVFEMLKNIFGPNMTSYMIVIFVGKDELGEGVFETQLPKAKSLQEVLQEADNRYLLFNNKSKDEQEKEQMVGQLMQMVNEVVSMNDGKCFRHSMSHMLDMTMAKMFQEEVRKRTGERLPVTIEEAEYNRPKPAPRKSATQIPSHESVEPQDEVGKETVEGDVSHADQQAVNKKQELRDLHQRGAVQARLQQFSKPEPESTEVEYRQRTPINSPRNSFEIKNTRGGERRSGEIPKQTFQEASEITPPQDTQYDPAHSDAVCHWMSDDVHVEEVLDQLQDQLMRELRASEDASFVYQVPDKPGMTLAEKQRLVENMLRKKIVSHPEELDEAQREEMEKAEKTVDQKLKEGMGKFGVKAIHKCRLM